MPQPASFDSSSLFWIVENLLKNGAATGWHCHCRNHNHSCQNLAGTLKHSDATAICVASFDIGSSESDLFKINWLKSAGCTGHTKRVQPDFLLKWKSRVYHISTTSNMLAKQCAWSQNILEMCIIIDNTSYSLCYGSGHSYFFYEDPPLFF